MSSGPTNRERASPSLKRGLVVLVVSVLVLVLVPCAVMLQCVCCRVGAADGELEHLTEAARLLEKTLWLSMRCIGASP